MLKVGRWQNEQQRYNGVFAAVRHWHSFRFNIWLGNGVDMTYKTKMIKGGDQVTLIVSPNLQETEITITCVNSPAKIQIDAGKLVKIFKGGNK